MEEEQRKQIALMLEKEKLELTKKTVEQKSTSTPVEKTFKTPLPPPPPPAMINLPKATGENFIEELIY